MLKRLALLLALASPAWAQPGPEWTRTTPAAAGWDIAALKDARAYADEIGTATTIIVQHGAIVESWGDISSRLALHSVRKSFLSALIGIAVAERRLDLDATLAQLGIDDTAPSLTPTEKQATLRELIEARSGVYHVASYETDGERRNRPERGSHPHGTFWYYNNWDFNTAGAIYERATNASIFQALEDRIARPLQMQDYRPTDGRYVKDADTLYPAYTLRMSARDLARFGLLFLHNGAWGPRQVVPPAWVAESTRAWSQTDTAGYGYMWWTAPSDAGTPAMSLPAQAFWADGAAGQFIVVDPAEDLVIVHQTDGETVGRRQFGHLIWLIRTAARLPAGPDPTLRRRPGARRQ